MQLRVITSHYESDRVNSTQELCPTNDISAVPTEYGFLRASPFLAPSPNIGTSMAGTCMPFWKGMI